jgi:Ca-activated chloride channel family protein
MEQLQFEEPLALILLAIIPLWAYWNRLDKKSTILYSSISSIKSLQPTGFSGAFYISPILRCLAIFFIVLSLARPQQGQTTREILTKGVDIILAVDTSGSMRALDFKKEDQRVTRLKALKDVASEFIKKRQQDRIGLVAFGQEAFTQCPLTLDQNILLSFLDQLSIGMAGDSTAIGSAIGIAAKRLKDLESKSKVIILLTDGRNTAGALAPIQGAEIAKALGIKVYTIGIGSRGKAPFLVDTLFGQKYVYQNVDIDETTLKEISKLTGAEYFRATDTESLQEIYNKIDELEKTEVKIKEYSRYFELFPYFLIPGLFLLLLEIITSQTRYQRVP